MASHEAVGSRLRQPVHSQSNDHGLIVSLSSSLFNDFGRFFNSISPFATNNGRGQTPRIYTRRSLPERNEQEDSSQSHSPNVTSSPWERQRQPNIMAHWSSDDTQLDTNIVVPTNHRRNSLFNVTTHHPVIAQDNVVINMEPNLPESGRLSEDSREAIHPGISQENVENQQSSNNSESGITSDENPDSAEESERNTTSVRINGESMSDILDRYPEVKELLKAMWQYFVFLLIIIAKIVFDRFTSLMVLILFWLTFLLSNRVVKKVLALPERLSPRSAFQLVTMFGMIPLVIYLFYFNTSNKLYYSAVLLPSDYEFHTLGDLLWVVIVTDYVIKLGTVIIKGFYATTSCVFLHHKQRGKHLALVEITSQLYRALAPVQPWLSFLLDNYTGMHKVFGVFLSAVYMLCKGPDIIYKVKNFLRVFKKFLEELNYGSAPSKSQLKDTGNTCPICQDDFVVPTMLHCKHIFCEECVARWFDRERTCPMCRTKIADDPTYRDGATSHSIQLY